MGFSDRRAPSYRFGIFEAFPESAELLRQGQPVRIQEQPFRLLVSLLEQPGEVVSRDLLRQRLWQDGTFVEFDQGLGAAVMKLRQALGDDADNPRFIETVPRRGFRFIAPVVSSYNDAAVAPTTVQTTPLPAGSGTAIGENRLHRRSAISAVAAAGLVGLLVALVWNVAPSSPPRTISIAQLTRDGVFKQGLLTDGMRLFTAEDRGSTNSLAETSVTGGDVAPIATPFAFVQLLDISPDHGQLLATSLSPTQREGPAWAIPLPTGAPQRIGDVIVHAASWSLDGRKLVFASGSDVFLAGADGTSPRKLINIPGIPFAPRFSPDAKIIRFTAVTSDNTPSIWEIRTDGADLHRLLPAASGPPTQCCGVWTSDGRYYFFLGSTADASNIWAIREKKSLFQRRHGPPIQLTAGPLTFGALAPSPDGRKLFAEAYQSRAQAVRYDSERKQFAPFLEGISAGEFDFSKNGQWVVYVSYPDGTLWRSRLDGSDRLQLTHAPMFAILPSWSPDGSEIAFVGGEIGKPWRVFLVPVNGGVPQEVYSERRSQGNVSWSPDGKELALGGLANPGIMFGRTPVPGSTENLEISILDLHSRRVSVIPGSTGLFRPRWSPDGRYIAGLTGDSKNLLLFDFKTQKWTTLESTTGLIAHPTWSQDGRYLYFDDHASNHTRWLRTRIGQQRKPELVADSTGLQRYIEPHVGPWVGLDPHGAPLMVRDLSTDELYVIDLQLP